MPGAIDPAVLEANDLSGGVILVGRPSLKEYMEGLKRGWSGSVDEWNWEKEVEKTLYGDGVFEGPFSNESQEIIQDTPQQQSMPMGGGQNGISPTGLSFLNRPTTSSQPSSTTTTTTTKPIIPSHLHIPPNPLPAQPPLLLVPWVNHLGFQQIPYMIRDFFTEHYRVEQGAKLAYALICGHTRPFVGASSSSSPSPSSSSSSSDLEFDKPAERYFKNDFDELPTRLAKAKEDYYVDLRARLAEVRALARGERELTDAEKKSNKPLVSEDDLREERKKKELRWRGQVEGWGIVRKEKEVTFEDGWEGWLNVFREPRVEEEPRPKEEGEKV